MQDKQKATEELWNQTSYTPENEFFIRECIGLLDRGQLRVASQGADRQWQIHEWVKKIVLLYFRIQKLSVFEAGDLQFFDKIPLKKWQPEMGVRAVPGAIARHGAHLASGVVLMPSFVNIGAFVDSGTMVDTWATVGSCAQVGKNVHLSGGVGIGGVLEPLQAQPVIVEDDCFLGSRSIVVEGVHLEPRVVLGAGVVLTGSTRILDVSGSQTIEMKGRVPEGSVVIPGSTSKKFPGGEYQVPCALIIGKRSATTDKKTSLNQALRDFQISV